MLETEFTIAFPAFDENLRTACRSAALVEDIASSTDSNFFKAPAFDFLFSYKMMSSM